MIDYDKIFSALPSGQHESRVAEVIRLLGPLANLPYLSVHRVYFRMGIRSPRDARAAQFAPAIEDALDRLGFALQGEAELALDHAAKWRYFVRPGAQPPAPPDGEIRTSAPQITPRVPGAAGRPPLPRDEHGNIVRPPRPIPDEVLAKYGHVRVSVELADGTTAAVIVPRE